MKWHGNQVWIEIKILQYLRILCQNGVVLKAESWILTHSPSLFSFWTWLGSKAPVVFWTHLWTPVPMCPTSINFSLKYVFLVHAPKPSNTHSCNTSHPPMNAVQCRAWEPSRSCLLFGQKIWRSHMLRAWSRRLWSIYWLWQVMSHWYHEFFIS